MGFSRGMRALSSVSSVRWHSADDGFTVPTGGTMEHDFWHERWSDGRIGFHEGRPNAFLARHVEVLGPPPGPAVEASPSLRRSILVPLAGKSQDLVYLASKGFTVVGVELSAKAVADFFAENGLVPTVATVGPFEVWSAGRIAMFVGDFFALAPAHLAAVATITALYDRAAIVALPPEMRARYADHVRTLLAPGTPGLIVTFDYPQELSDGPPFSVPGAELRRLYEGLAIEEIDSAMADAPRLRDLGITCVERCFTVRF